MSAPTLFLDGKVALHEGDCLAVLKTFASASIDAIVSDPPYGIAFMGRAWDTAGPDQRAFSVAFWKECFRVLKPGGHLLAFSANRTVHRMTVAIEDAGFEIRDAIWEAVAADTHVAAFMASLDDEQRGAFMRCCENSTFGGMMAWVFGSGFPKSMDVSKAIDKQRDDAEPVRVVCRFVRAAMDRLGLKSRDLTHHFGNCNARLIDHWAARDTDSQPSLPTPEQWVTLKRVLTLADSMDSEVARLNARKGELGDVWKGAEILGEHDGAPGGFGDHRFEVRDNKIRALSDLAVQWQGFGTALKPALEPITLARKPLDGTVAANVLKHGVGALNIDGCRVDMSAEDAAYIGERIGGFNNTRSIGGSSAYGGGEAMDRAASYDASKGRFPANLILDGSDEVAAPFPETGGSSVVKEARAYEANGRNAVYGAGMGGGFHPGDGAGSAARYFYTAKADALDRVNSKHPTIKPLDLMQYLVRLVTPPGGLVLDPFAGSGTTGEAAWREGLRAILIEREPKHCIDIARRMELATAPLSRRAATVKGAKLAERAERDRAAGKLVEPDSYSLF
ncbi:DNA methyltransferase [Methylobacterium gnaphalii]|uniref:site-specific DNA-methyltransferase (adenine-specific) n=1 Tax=Methylobacterium gnaphalii TaxID=1010610 RepID=A0A512JPE4_9HYPH|nr:DNA methyltransferase [Methylobacterium gnaphalii]GEP11802.1 hypothetical protein MGN01_36470 [Methylobacterium gnaphalii]GJD69479.1 hypothetical protein MMMDOFMJ_2410 [Methylobacterium gnaphalii]GLS49563.1 hypothetical protein GCM10007885_24120 [Methylobacterium gnaphalii]